jgi:hypothetical protein
MFKTPALAARGVVVGTYALKAYVFCCAFTDPSSIELTSTSEPIRTFRIRALRMKIDWLTEGEAYSAGSGLLIFRLEVQEGLL